MGKGGGGGGQTQSTVTNTNIPEYARGYVENMLSATQRELFSGEEGPNGEFNITGFKPYKSYGGTYDESGNMTSYDPSAAVAGFTPMQQMAQNGIYNLQMPGEFGSASEYTANAMQRAANAGYDAGQFTMGNVRGENAQNTYLGQAPTYRGQQLNYTPQNIGFERVNAPQLRDLQMRSAGNVGTQSFTQPGAQQRFMDPYMQNVVDTQTREAQRMADRAAVQRKGARAQQGAYGGSAAALENAEANRNLATQLGNIQAQGSQAAYQSGMGQFNTEAQNRLQADLANQQVQQQTGVQNLSAALQTQGLGAQTELTAQQLNQAAGIDTSKFNQTQQYNTALQNAQMLQQQQLANQALRGQYGLTQGQLGQANNQFNAQQRQAANLANQQMLFNTQQAGEQSRQFGANYGQQMNAQQLAAAQQLGGLGQQRLTAQQGIYGLQNQVGGQQQQYQQQIINQAMQDYSNAQQYPMMQLGTMSNMLRGLPMQATTTNMYQAAPNAISQGIGAVGAYGALNNAFGSPAPTGRKEGGVIHAAKGGIMSYDVGGEIESTLSKMDVNDLKKYAKESSSPSVKQMAARLIQEKSIPVPRMARGGILAFAKSTEENNRSLVEGEDKKYGGWPSWLYNPGEALSNINPLRMMAERHAESFGTNPTAPAAPPPEPSAFVAGPDVNPQDVRLANARPPAPPVPPQGIAQAAAATAPPRPPVARPPAGPAPAPPPPSAGISAPSYPDRPDIPDTPEHAAYRTQAAAANANANKTVAQHLEDIKAEQVAAGLEPENKAIQDYRARMMAERANMDDEAKRQKNLRLAEFFASWGSTPGATLVAGMTALKKTIPTLIEDEKERKKATREADKIIYELDQAVRLEKKGDINAATDRKQNAAKIAEPYNSTLAKLSQDKMTAATAAQGDMARFASQNFATTSSERSHKYTADAGVRAAEIREQSAHADRVANRQTADENKRFGQYQAAAEQERRALSRIATEENGDQYKADLRLLESGASSTNPTMIEMRKQAEKRVNARKEEWNTIRDNAKRDTELAYSRLEIQGAPPRNTTNSTNDPLGLRK